MARFGTGFGQVLAAGAVLVAPLVACVPQTPIGTYEWEDLESRASVAPMPLAPTPFQGRRMVDLAVREIGATRTSGGELGGHTETGSHPLLTDGALSLRFSRSVALRFVGGIGYGSPIGPTTDVPFSARPTGTGGVSAVFGWWGERDWSVSFSIDTSLAILSNRERYEVVQGPCFSSPSFLGSGTTIGCTIETRTGELRFYEGMLVAPNFGTTFEGAGYALPWLRLGGSFGLATAVSRPTFGGLRWEPVGIARLFVEAHVDDVWIGIEAQQWLHEDVTFAPALGVTLGGMAFDRPTRAPAPPPEPEVPPIGLRGWRARVPAGAPQ